MKNAQHFSAVLAALIVFCGPHSGASAQESAARLFRDASESTHVFIVHTTLKQALEKTPVIDRLIIQKGRYNLHSRSDLQLKGVLQTDGQHLIEVLDDAGETIFRTAFRYPKTITVPPLPGGQTDYQTPNRIEIEEPAAAIVIPYYPEAAWVRIVKPDGSTAASKPVSEATQPKASGDKDSKLSEPAQEGSLYILILSSGYNDSNSSSFTARAE